MTANARATVSRPLAVTIPSLRPSRGKLPDEALDPLEGLQLVVQGPVVLPVGVTSSSRVRVEHPHLLVEVRPPHERGDVLLLQIARSTIRVACLKDERMMAPESTSVPSKSKSTVGKRTALIVSTGSAMIAAYLQGAGTNESPWVLELGRPAAPSTRCTRATAGASGCTSRR